MRDRDIISMSKMINLWYTICLVCLFFCGGHVKSVESALKISTVSGVE